MLSVLLIISIIVGLDLSIRDTSSLVGGAGLFEAAVCIAASVSSEISSSTLSN